MADRKAVVKNADMSEDMQQDAVDCASQALEKLRGDTIIIIVAHRLSTIMNADLVIYMKDGVVIDIGSFEELRIRVPEFNSQAKLMGL